MNVCYKLVKFFQVKCYDDNMRAKGFDGYYILVDQYGHEIGIGATVTDFRGETFVILSGNAPHKPASTGKVYLQSASGFQQEFFPSVIGAKWVKDWRQRTNPYCQCNPDEPSDAKVFLQAASKFYDQKKEYAGDKISLYELNGALGVNKNNFERMLATASGQRDEQGRIFRLYPGVGMPSKKIYRIPDKIWGKQVVTHFSFIGEPLSTSQGSNEEGMFSRILAKQRRKGEKEYMKKWGGLCGKCIEPLKYCETCDSLWCGCSPCVCQQDGSL
ncbi:hypothetical protein C4588_06895 [Candidatus Parcubacteria bacterium]|nr:MAG: hypothetical protein C4588_06895 [Candidatus Parcubacteria bacterium]